MQVREHSPLTWFFDNFLREGSIQWLLGTGVVILVGSSLMLVGTHWQSYAPVWKHLVLLAYTAATCGGAILTYDHLGLRRTGRVLHGLSVLLVPITFLALGWVGGTESLSTVQVGLRLALFAGNLAFAAWLARRVFLRFLREPTPTFTASYLLLCAAGTFAPGVPAAWAPWAALAAWAVFAVGAIKVNRHVFWLTEEHRAPRVLGFLPMILLAGQFLLLVLGYFAGNIRPDWLGCGAVLASVPIIVAADAWVSVFRHRTGDLVRPLPSAIVLPVVSGLALCAAGLGFAASGFPPRGRPDALVPAALVASGLLCGLAYRTRRQGFTWAALLVFTVAYNFSPVYFTGLARWVVDTGAHAVRESRLPYAFYGLTYLPFFLGLTWLASRTKWRDAAWVVRPLRLFCAGLSSVLLAASLAHSKAILPVAASLGGVLAVGAFAFRDRRFALLSVVSIATASLGFVPFVERVLEWSVPFGTSAGVLSLTAAGLLLVSRWYDRALAERTDGGMSANRSGALAPLVEAPFRASSFVLAAAAAVLWLGACAARIQYGSDGLRIVGALAWWPAIASSVVLFAHAARSSHGAVSDLAVCFMNAAPLMWALAAGVPHGTLVAVATALLGAQWAIGRLAGGSGGDRPLALSLQRVARVGLSVLLAGLYLLTCVGLATDIAIPTLFSALRPGGDAVAEPALWVGAVLAVAWSGVAAYVSDDRTLGFLSVLGNLGLIASATVGVAGPQAREWIPAVLIGLALAARPMLGRLEARVAEVGFRSLVAPTLAVLRGLFCLGAVLPLVVYTPAFQVAGGIAAAGIYLEGLRRQSVALRMTSLVLVNWQILAFVTGLFCPAIETILDVPPATVDGLARAALPVACVAAASVLAWSLAQRSSRSPVFETLVGHLTGLRILAGGAVLCSFLLPGLGALEIVCASLAFGLLAASEIVAACRDVEPRRVWYGESLIAVGIGYLAWFGVISFGHGTSLYVLVGSGLLTWALGNLAAKSQRAVVLAEPLRVTGLVLPAVAVCVGIGQHLAGTGAPWLGTRSLALLLGGAFYFWRGLEDRDRRCLVLAAATLNAGLAVLWSELRWSDPQLTMIPIGVSIIALVELLKQEIPQRLRNPLRYAGALAILVSPVFHIVDGSWVHILTLMVGSAGVIVVSVGLRVRALMYTGMAFLAADLVTAVVRGSLAYPSLLWIVGLGLGGAVIVLGAVCENYRESLLQRLRAISYTLGTWE